MMNRADLQRFCSTTHARFKICAPFSQGDWTYATDGCIAVRVPRLADTPDVAGAPKASTLFTPTDLQFSPAKFRELPELPEKEECEDCGAPVHDCPSCTCECLTCGDTGFVDGGRIAVGLRGAAFDLKYVRMLAELPALALPLIADPSNKVPMRFFFDGGEGALMPTSSAVEIQAEVVAP